MTELYRPDWALPAGVQARYSGRAGGVSVAPYDTLNLGDHVGDNPQAVAENRARLLAQLPGCDDIQWLEQVHGIDVAEARPQAPVVCADASVSAAAGVACAVLTADCLPVLFCARDGSRVAAAHAGWRGLAGGILPETLKQFSDPGDVLCFWRPPSGPRLLKSARKCAKPLPGPAMPASGQGRGIAFMQTSTPWPASSCNRPVSPPWWAAQNVLSRSRNSISLTVATALPADRSA